MTGRIGFREMAVIAGIAGLLTAGAPPASTLQVAPPGEPGTRLTLTGVMQEKNGRPVAGAELHVYQTDSTGRYTPERPMDEPHARLSGRLRTGVDGRFELRTIRPGGYPKAIRLGDRERKIPAHIHIDVTAPGRSEHRFQAVFADDPLLEDPYWKDWIKAPRRPVVQLRRGKQGVAGTVTLVLD